MNSPKVQKSNGKKKTPVQSNQDNIKLPSISQYNGARIMQPLGKPHHSQLLSNKNLQKPVR